MTLGEQRIEAERFFILANAKFFRTGLNLIVLKGSDYAPEEVAMTEVFFTAAELNLSPPQVLWVHVKKHTSAISKYMAQGRLGSEDIRSRLLDVSNYMALIDTYVANPSRWMEHLETLVAASSFPNRTPEEIQALKDWVRHQSFIAIHGE